MIRWASRWHRGFLFFVFVCGGHRVRARSPGVGQSTWPYPWRLSVSLPWFYSAPLSLTAGFYPDQCGTADADSIDLLSSTDRGCRMFQFMLLSPNTFSSLISPLKSGWLLFFWKLCLNGAGRAQGIFAILGKHCLCSAVDVTRIHTQPNDKRLNSRRSIRKIKPSALSVSSLILVVDTVLWK